MSHYPTSAELATFRRSIELAANRSPRLPDGGLRLAIFGPHHDSENPGGAAYTYELRDGIGYRIERLPSPAWHQDPLASRATLARREAAAMRSRAFARSAFGDSLRNGLHPCASPTERALGCPMQGPTARGTTQAEYYGIAY